MSNADWYAQKLAQARQQPAPTAPPTGQPPHYPPVAPPVAPGQLPPHLAPYASPPQAYQPPAPGTPQDPAYQQGQPSQYFSYDAQTGAQVADDGTIKMLHDSAARTGGSTVVRANTTQCPNCFKDTFFEIQEGGIFSKLAGGTVHAKQCASCGFPKVQAGSTGGSLASARSSGPARQARQLPSNHRVTVAVEGGGYATFEPPTGA